MYGIVNRAIEDLVTTNFGEARWQAVKKRSAVDVDFFVSSEPYDDDITYALANAVSEEMNMPLQDVLQAFGEWWILKTGKEKYGGLMQAGGKNFKEFIVNLPLFHNRIMFMYPKLTPPEFKVDHLTDNSVWLHYFSKRQGLQEFVRGLLTGLAKMYDVHITLELLQSRGSGSDHEIFKINW
ncbi:heme NO-binding domain-containing protein [Panacibacter sp. DH6]|uniref:Heme NO-binding domain-containing protein n=1 Tax=Panacibacter microcysteis TaxID=2793269 RepID=A0A931GZ78_9BACT|nr:heme NO-binding domain-containing protein [Panacibacter microcysteis]MBG9378075.1 heme NO-binding domain-containing protein [Panacibacter microcysteis]